MKRSSEGSFAFKHRRINLAIEIYPSEVWMAPQLVIVCYLTITESKAFLGVHLEQVFDDAYKFTTT